MYTKDKSNRITLRLNDRQFAFVKASADLLGVSPSDFLRMVINASMKTQGEKINAMTKGAKGRENDTANIDDLV